MFIAFNFPFFSNRSFFIIVFPKMPPIVLPCDEGKDQDHSLLELHQGDVQFSSANSTPPPADADVNNSSPFVSKFEVDQAKTGICYLPTVPPRITVGQVRQILDLHCVDGKKEGGMGIGRIYLKPKGMGNALERETANTNMRFCDKFEDGWVEFLSKNDAKRVARDLNGQMIGCAAKKAKKRGQAMLHDQIWCIKYLPTVKWADLLELKTYNAIARTVRLRNSMGKAEAQNDEYLNNFEKRKRRKTAPVDKKSKRGKVNTQNEMSVENSKTSETVEKTCVNKSVLTHSSKKVKVEEKVKHAVEDLNCEPSSDKKVKGFKKNGDGAQQVDVTKTKRGLSDSLLSKLAL